MTSYKNILVFTDLDGTLIDHETYSWKGAEEALKELKKRKIPIIFCSSKTRAEIEVYRKKIGIEDPFISENGGGIFIPINYFNFDFPYNKKDEKYLIIELGTPYKILRKALEKLKKFGTIRGFGDMTIEEISYNSGLSIEEAKLAKRREYDEAFIFEGDEDSLKKGIEKLGLNWTRGGRYWHITGENDKGKAIKILEKLFIKRFGGEIKTIGIGDSLNDLPMLQSVDVPILVQKKNNGYDERVKLKNLIKAHGSGPEGWNYEILKILYKNQG